MKQVFLFALLAFATIACNRDDDDEDQQPLVDDSFVRAIVNDSLVLADFKVILQDPVANAYFPSQQFLQVQRFVENGNPQGFNIVVERINLDQLTLPAIISHSDDLSEPTLIFNYYDDRDSVYLQNIADPSSFTLTLNSFVQDNLIGTFEGELFTRSQDSVRISQGQFEVALRRY